jgi:hypothetical protein
VIGRLVELLREEQLRQKLSLNDVAARSGLSHTMVLRVEMGRLPSSQLTSISSSTSMRRRLIATSPAASPLAAPPCDLSGLIVFCGLRNPEFHPRRSLRTIALARKTRSRAA